jgi:hypothetical protein
MDGTSIFLRRARARRLVAVFSPAARLILVFGEVILAMEAVSFGDVPVAWRERTAWVIIFLLTGAVAGFVFMAANPCLVAATSSLLLPYDQRVRDATGISHV